MPYLSPSVKSILQTAKVVAVMNSSKVVNPEHVYKAFIMDDTSNIRKILIQEKVISPQELTIANKSIPPGHEVPEYSEEIKTILTQASAEAGKELIEDIDVFKHLTQYLEKEQSSVKLVIDSKGFSRIAESYEGEGHPSALEVLCEDLTLKAREGKLDPVIGRDKEIDFICSVLCRKKKPNPLLIGEPGVGKTAIVELLAQRIVAGDVPKKILNKRIMSLQLARLNAGSGIVGALEQQMLGLVDEIRKEGNIILYIDEIHQVSGHNNAGYLSTSAANMLKSPLARGIITCIGSTTTDEYKNSIEKDGAMNRRFQRINIEAPTDKETVAIVNGLAQSFESFHKVTVEPEVPQLIAKLSSVFITGKQQPDSSVDLLDDACVLAANRKGVVNAEVVYNTVSKLSGIPVQHVTKSMDCSHLRTIEPYLLSRVFGQEEAMHDLAATVIKGQLGVSDRKRPLGVFLFLGPTGVGKTESAKALAQALFGTEDALIRLDMSEIAGGFGGTRIIGAPPGFVGYYDNNSFTEKVRDRPYSVVLFDEIEKSSRDVHNILLQIMEEGMATDGRGRKVNFRNTVIVMTGNVGSEFYMEGKLGFGSATASVEAQVMKSLSNHFKPEFVNRIDKVACFKPLSPDIALAVSRKLLSELAERVAEQGVTLKFDDIVPAAIVKASFKPQFGARAIRRFIDEVIQDLVANEIMNGNFDITLHYADENFTT